MQHETAFAVRWRCGSEKPLKAWVDTIWKSVNAKAGVCESGGRTIPVRVSLCVWADLLSFMGIMYGDGDRLGPPRRDCMCYLGPPTTLIPM